MRTLGIFSSILGSAVWGGLWFFLPPSNTMECIPLLFLFAPLVTVPLAWHLIESRISIPQNLFWLRKVQLPCALLAASSFFFQEGLTATAMASIWLLFTLVLAYCGFSSWYFSNQRLPYQFAYQAALVYLVSGGVWFVAARAGYSLLGFSPTFVLLTAVHFHYASLVSLTFAGYIGEKLYSESDFRSLYGFFVLSLVLAPACIAVGILQFPTLEIVGVAWFVSSLYILAFLLLKIAGKNRSFFAKILWTISALSLFLTMAYALVYGTSEFIRDLEYYELWQKIHLTIPRMVEVHGFVNALGFALCGFWAAILHQDKDA